MVFIRPGITARNNLLAYPDLVSNRARKISRESNETDLRLPLRNFHATVTQPSRKYHSRNAFPAKRFSPAVTTEFKILLKLLKLASPNTIKSEVKLVG